MLLNNALKWTLFTFNKGWIYGGLLPHFFVFDFFCNFRMDSMKNLLEVLRFFPLLNLDGKKIEKNLRAGRHVTSKVW